MKLKVVTIISLVGVSFLAVWALYEKEQTEQLALSGLYLGTATEMRNYLHALTELREGRTQGAITHLERLLETRSAILEGCKIDLCKSGFPAEYSEPIALLAKYKNKYQQQ